MREPFFLGPWFIGLIVAVLVALLAFAVYKDLSDPCRCTEERCGTPIIVSNGKGVTVIPNCQCLKRWCPGVEAE